MVIGEVCLGKVHQPESVITNKTYLISKDRESVCQPCPNSMRSLVFLVMKVIYLLEPAQTKRLGCPQMTENSCN